MNDLPVDQTDTETEISTRTPELFVGPVIVLYVNDGNDLSWRALVTGKAGGLYCFKRGEEARVFAKTVEKLFCNGRKFKKARRECRAKNIRKI